MNPQINQFNQLKTTYNDSFQKQRAKIKVANSLYKQLPKIKVANSLYKQLPSPWQADLSFFQPTNERRQIVATLDKIFDFFDRVFSAENFCSQLNQNSLKKLQEEGRDLNIRLTAVNDDLLSKAHKATRSGKPDPIKEDPMYKDIFQISQNLQGFLNEGFARFFNQVERLLPNPDQAPREIVQADFM